jgi:hypothetical protein
MALAGPRLFDAHRCGVYNMCTGATGSSLEVVSMRWLPVMGLVLLLGVMGGCGPVSRPEVRMVAPASVIGHAGEPLIIQIDLENLPPGELEFIDAFSSYLPDPPTSVRVPWLRNAGERTDHLRLMIMTHERAILRWPRDHEPCLTIPPLAPHDSKAQIWPSATLELTFEAVSPGTTQVSFLLSSVDGEGATFGTAVTEVTLE